MVLDGFFQATFGKLLALPSPLGLFLVSLILTVVMIIVYKYMTDQQLMKKLKDEMNNMKAEMKQFKNEPAKMMQINKEIWEKNMTYMKHSLKPNLITFVPIIFIFSWLRNYYTALGNPPVFLGLSWLWAYIIFSLLLNMLLRKLMKVH